MEEDDIYFGWGKEVYDTYSANEADAYLGDSVAKLESQSQLVAPAFIERFP